MICHHSMTIMIVMHIVIVIHHGINLHGDCNVIVINYIVLKYNINDMNCVLE